MQHLDKVDWCAIIYIVVMTAAPWVYWWVTQ